MKFVIILMLLLLFILAGCNNLTVMPTAVSTLTATHTAVPTSLPIATNTTTATATSTETPAPTNIPTATPTVTPVTLPEIVLGERLNVDVGGFSFQPIEGYETAVDAGAVFMTDESGIIIFSITGVPEAGLSGKTTLEVIDEFLTQIADVSDGEFIQGEPYAMVIAGGEATAVDLTGELFGREIAGQAVYINPFANQVFFALGVADLAGGEDLWVNVGQPSLTAMLETVEFLPLSP